ncbi:TPA: antiviral RADAR system adenosine triphosphatase RdrA [Enterobacter hormaechei subsp. xiangfangensis]
MTQQEKNKYIPLNVGETAVLHDANTLLPREEIYEQLAVLIRQARNRAIEAKDKSLNELRAHNAISIDGARGTGKTAVLVNLKRYLELEHNDLLSDIHIMEPIDPTLLEDGESLFLHIIVAAVLHDDGIKQAQCNKPEQSRALNRALDKLAHTLEAVDTQKEHSGMDKVRAMYGNKHLADSVQDFFREAVHLLGKKLLVLPIDDVDTSLNRAFENLEIIRRYMTTPYVLPIVSGDRALYHEVTWRDFHGRLIKDSDYLAESAYERSLELAEEYQRKILPFPRRLTMPAVSSYWQQTDIYLRSEKFGDIMPLRNFIAWLEIFISGPVNGQEDSRIILPIPSIRSLTQLIGHCSSFIALLPDAIRTAKNELEVRRVWQMPTVPLEVMAAFQDKHKELSEKSKREYTDAYKLFTEKMKELSPVNYSFDKVENDNKNNITKNDLAVKMADYFRFESKAGAVYLVLIAKQYWQNWTNTDSLVRQGSIFDTPLFQPLTHNTANLAFFDKTSDLSAWASALEERLPEEWLIGLKSHQTILPYPVAEVGINAATAWDYQGMIERIVLNDEGKKKATFLINLLVQYNFYTNAKQTMLLNIGRIFELIISSIAGPISREDLQTILSRAPFFSTRALAPTKTLLIDYLKTENRSTTGVQNITGEAETVAEPSDEFDPIVVLQNDIDNWRKEHNLEQVELSPWLVYKVFNKVYSQLASNEKIPSGMKNVGIAMNMVAHTFYATWSAFGSFEKGELFGLPNVVATTNLNADKLNNFEKNDHFNINVGPFAPSNSQIENDNEPYQIRSTYGKSTRTISYCLAEHPLRKWIDELIEVEWPSVRTAKEVLLEELNLPETDRIPWTKIELQLKDDPDSARELLENLEAQFGVNDIIVKNLKTRLTKLHPENNS